MSSLVSYVRHRNGRRIGKLPLNRKIPGVDGGKDVGVAANLRIVSDADRNQAAGGNRRKDKSGGPDGKIEGSCIGAAIGQVLVDQDGKILGQHVSEDRSEDSNIEAPPVASPNDSLGD